MGILAYQFARTAVTKHHKLGLKHWHLRPHSAEGWQSEIKAVQATLPLKPGGENPSCLFLASRGLPMAFVSPWLAAA